MDIIATVYAAYTGHETFDIGRDEGLPVNEEYAGMGKFEFTPRQLHKVVFDIANPEVQEVHTSNKDRFTGLITFVLKGCFLLWNVLYLLTFL